LSFNMSHNWRANSFSSGVSPSMFMPPFYGTKLPNFALTSEFVARALHLARV
jgi:hypothetical protein